MCNKVKGHNTDVHKRPHTVILCSLWRVPGPVHLWAPFIIQGPLHNTLPQFKALEKDIDLSDNQTNNFCYYNCNVCLFGICDGSMPHCVLVSVFSSLIGQWGSISKLLYTWKKHLGQSTFY